MRINKLIKAFDSTLLSGEFIAQNVEVATDYYFSKQKGLGDHLCNLYVVKNNSSEWKWKIKHINVAIFPNLSYLCPTHLNKLSYLYKSLDDFIT